MYNHHRAKRTIIVLLVPLIIVLLNNCSLSKTQIKTCNTYFEHLDDFYNYVNIVNEYAAKAKYNRHVITASCIDSTALAIELLDSAISHYQDDLSMPFGLRRSLMRLDNYVVGYNFKSSYNTDFLSSTRSFLVEYIPFGVGNIIYQVIYATRKMIIKPNVGKKIKKHVESGNEFIPLGAEIIIDYSEDYIEELKTDQELIKHSYIIFTENLNDPPDSWKNYSMYQPIFIENFKELYVSQQMAEHLIFACNNLKEAQGILYKNTRKYKKIKKSIPELTDFYVEITYLRDLENILKNNQ